jgi:peptide/nickel transport system substrate-binding protein
MGKGRRRRRLVAVGSALAVAGLITTACSSSSGISGPAKGQPVATQAVTIRLTGDWQGLDPVAGPVNSTSSQLIVFTYDRLVAINPATQAVIPYVATSWTASNTQVTFHLRNNVVCSDGHHLTATDVQASFEQAVKGTQALRLFGPGPYTMSSDNATNTFTFKVGTPFQDLIKGFGDPYASVVCPAGLANLTALQNTPQGSGPYILTQAIHNQQATFKLRSDWTWGPDGTTSATVGLPKTVVLKVVTDDTTAANLFLTGALNAGEDTGPNTARLKADPSLTYFTATGYLTYLLSLNDAPGRAGHDPAVRKAIYDVINPAGWNQGAFDGLGITSPSYLTTNAACFDKAMETGGPGPSYSVAAARNVLIDAGYKPGSNGIMAKNGKQLVINIIAPTKENSGPAYVAGQIEQLGIKVNLSILPVLTWDGLLYGYNYDISFPNPTDEIDVPGSYFPFVSGPPAPKGLSLVMDDDPMFNKLVTAAEAAPDGDCSGWDNVQLYIRAHYLFVPLSTPITYWFARNVTYQASFLTIQPWTIRGLSA